MARRIDSYIPGAFGLSGVRSLLVEEELYANQVLLEVPKTTATHKIIKLPKDCLLEMVMVKNTAVFDGALKLGKSGNDEAFLTDANYPKTVGLHDPLMIGEPIDANTTVQLKVSGCSTGAGKIWLFWRPLL